MTIALSSIEVEYIAAVRAPCEITWLRQILADLGLPQKNPTTLQIDNQSAIKLAKNPVFYARSKHIETKHHFIRKLVESKIVELHYCPSNDQIADLFIKPLEREKFCLFRDLLGIRN